MIIREMPAHFAVQTLGQGVQLRQCVHRLHHIMGKQAHEGGHDAGDLRVAGTEVARAVKFLQKEASRPAVARRGQQIGIRV